jgi:hypothetical protein
MSLTYELWKYYSDFRVREIRRLWIWLCKFPRVSMPGSIYRTGSQRFWRSYKCLHKQKALVHLTPDTHLSGCYIFHKVCYFHSLLMNLIYVLQSHKALLGAVLSPWLWHLWMDASVIFTVGQWKVWPFQLNQVIAGKWLCFKDTSTLCSSFMVIFDPCDSSHFIN